jgi:flagellar L-ring protein precursor FlgH
MKRILIIITLIVFISGCGVHTKPSMKREPKYENLDSVYFDLPSNEGSLWKQGNNGLFADGQAHKKGDTIIVDIVENTSSQTAASTSLEKESTVEVGVPNALGYMSHLTALFPRMNSAKLFNATTTNDFEGKGSSDRSTSLKGSVGARVVEVLPNGDLVISGRKDVKINNETQIMKVTGIVRPKDVGSDNRVESTYLANADIEITGKGVISDKQKPGWMARIIDSAWPF